MRHSLNYANTVLRCSCWKIHRYIAATLFYFRKVAVVLPDSSKPLLFFKNEWVECWFGSREYWLIYRGPGFLAVVCLGTSPTFTPPPPHVSNLSLFLSPLRLLPGGCGRGAESYHGVKSWSPVNHSILSDWKSAEISTSSERIHWKNRSSQNWNNQWWQSLTLLWVTCSIPEGHYGHAHKHAARAENLSPAMGRGINSRNRALN